MSDNFFVDFCTLSLDFTNKNLVLKRKFIDQLSALFKVNEFLNINMNKKKREGSERLKVSWTYVPGSDQPFLLKDLWSTLDSASSLKKNKFLLTEFLALITGIANTWTKNKNYKNLIFNMNLQDRDECDVIEYWEKKHLGNTGKWKQSADQRFKYSIWIQDVPQKLKDEVIERQRAGWKISTILAAFSLSSAQIRVIINERKFALMDELRGRTSHKTAL